MLFNPELKSLITEIATHNLAVYDSTPLSEKIDFSKTKVNWGTNTIDRKFFIDITKPVLCFDGSKVLNLSIVLHNSVGAEVTFPLKGTIVIKRDGKKDKHQFMTWTLDGRIGVAMNDFENPHNIFNPAI